VLTGKAGRSPADARTAILSWRDAISTRDTTDAAFLAAMDLVADHHVSIWDALILAVAADAGCRLLLTEDLQEGFTWRGVRVVNPFADTIHPLLAGLLSSGNGVH
jgi:predicted nucleic acid-binding protein